MIRQWREDYQERGYYNHRGVNGRLRISTAVWNQIRDLFINDTIISLPVVAAKLEFAFFNITQCSTQRVEALHYKLQLSTALN